MGRNQQNLTQQKSSSFRAIKSNLLNFENERVREDAEIEEVEETHQSWDCMQNLEDNQVQSQTPIESTVLKCKLCSKTYSSLKGLKIHKTKSHLLVPIDPEINIIYSSTV